MTPRLVERFWDGVSVRGIGECWPWLKAAVSNGWYGRMTVRERRRNFRVCYRPSRVCWTIHYGPIPEGLYVCHQCDNPPCCNPAHLWLGSTADNVRDAAVKGRMRGGYAGATHCKYGHAFTPENTYQTPRYRLHRVCRQCAARRQREMRADRKASGG